MAVQDIVVFDPRNSRCIECGAEFQQPERRQGGGTTKVFCSSKCRARSWARGNTEKRKVSVVKYERKPQSVEKKKLRNRAKKFEKYGITEDEFHLTLHQQHAKCCTCGGDIDEWSARIDHCHKTGVFRGLLCDSCNWALGHVRDSIKTLNNMIRYLKAHE